MVEQPRIIIIGAGGHGRVILDTVQELGIEVVGFIDDNIALQGKRVDGVPVIGHSSSLDRLQHDGIGILLGIGDNAIRARFYQHVKNLGFQLFNAIHPRAVVSRNTDIGEGVVVMGGVVINTGTRVGNDVCINTGATVDHDNVVEDHVHIYPGAHLVGGVKIKRYAYVSSGAIVAPCITIGENATVAAGAVVLEDVPDHAVVAGVPGKIVRYKNPQDLGRLR